MVFETTSNQLDKISADAVLIFVFKDKEKTVKTEGFNYLDKVLGGLLSETLKEEDFKANKGQFMSVHTHRKILASKIFILSLGEKKDFNDNNLRSSLSLFAKAVHKSISSLALALPSELSFVVSSKTIAEGVLLGSYEFNKYRTKKEEKKNLETVIIGYVKKEDVKKVQYSIKEAELIRTTVKLARDLVNEPGGVVTPLFLAKTAQDIAKGNPDLTCKVFDKPELEKMGMNAFLGVAQASDTPPKFIVLEYNPGKSSLAKKLAIIGKGITFDTGGISLKPESSMTTMKCDMAGAAAVLGLFSVISKIKPSFSVMGIIAATSNMISGKSLVPGDVLKAYNGKTIEILNTDAEGRVTMADSLSYAVKKGATELIDLATLTGACEVALGTEYTALFGNNEELSNKLKEAAKKSGEKIWELPLVKEYKELNKSDVADIANIPNTRWGGAITAALFLEEFVDGKPWVHFDIAGPAFSEKGNDLGPKGGTGFGVRLLIEYLKNADKS